MPREAAWSRAARWASVALRGGDGAERGGAYGVVGVARSAGASGWYPARPVTPGTRSSRAVVTTAEWTSIRVQVERAAAGRLVELGARAAGGRSGQRAASQPCPRRTRSAGRAGGERAYEAERAVQGGGRRRGRGR